MSRWPPSILSVVPDGDGGLEVTWEVDHAFGGDAEEPEQVLVDLDGQLVEALAGDETSATIPAERLDPLVAAGRTSVVVSVSFRWAGPPAEELQSSVVVPVAGGGGGGGGGTGVDPAGTPVVTLRAVRPRTAAAPATIEVGWRSTNYNDGSLTWGPADAPGAYGRSIRPVGEVYEGTFTTDQPLRPGTSYVFTVSVRNTLHSPTWRSASLVVRSPGAVTSLRAFLLQSGHAPASGVRAAIGGGRSVRVLLLG